MRHLKRSGMQRVKRQATVEALEQRTLLSAIYSTTMDTNPGWTLDTGWAYGVPAGTGGDPSSSQVHTGTKVVGTVITSPGYYPDNVPSTYYAKTAAIDCSSYTGVTLDFWRWLGVEGNDKAYVQVGSNGTWTTLWTNSGTVNESSWSHQTYDISSAADYQGTVYIRWGLGPTNASIHYCGWNIDDVTVSGNLDTTPPTVSSINRVGTTSTNASSVQFAVTLSESVTGVDTSDFALASTGTAAGSIASVSGSGSSYTLTVDSVTGDGTLGLNLADNDTVLDLAGNKLGGTGTGNGNFTGQTYTLDHTAPLVGSINRVGSTPTNASSMQFAVTLSESVTGVDTSDFALATTGTAAGTIASVSGSGSSYTVTVNSVTGDGTLGLNLVDNDSIQDSAGNKLGGTGTGNGNFTGQPFTVDHTAPLVSSINRVGTSPTNASSVQFAVTLTESVTGVDTSDFALASTGAASGSIASVSGSGSSYTVTVNSVTGDGTLGLNLVDDDSVQDSASNKLGGTGTGNGNFMGQTFTLDHTAPVVSSITRVGAALTNASSVQFSVTLSESVTGVDVSDFVLASTEAVSGSIASVSGAGSSYTVTVNSVIGDGTLGLNLVDNDSVTDAVGNALGGSGAANGSYTGEVCTIDQTPPVLLSLKAVRTPTNSPDLEWLATFSESVSNVHYSDFALLGGVPAVVATAYGYGGGIYYDIYVTAAREDGNSCLALIDNDTIVDAAGNKLGGTGLRNGDKTGDIIWLDFSPPSVACINSVGATPTNASTVQWSITFREPVIGVDVSDFVVDATGTAAASNAVLSGSGLDYTLTVTTAGNGNLTPRLVDDDSITDSAGNPLSGTGIGNGTFTGQSITVDHVPPVVTSILEGNSSLNAVDFVVRFSEAVTGVDLTDLSAAFFGTAGGSLTGITGSGGYYTVTIGSLVGDGAVKLNLVDDDSIADLVGNKLGGTGSENGSFTGGSAVVDHTPPVVASITRLNSTPTKATNVQWRVLFSEYVTGVTFNDFSFATAGHLGWLTGTGYDYTLDLDVTYTAGLTVAPQLVDDDSIVDFVGNKLGGTGTGNGNFTGPSYTVDHTPPGLASTSVNGGAAQRSMVTQVEAVFSEAVNLSAGALTVLWRDGSALLGTFTVSIVNTSGDQRTWDITFSGRGAIGNSLSDGFYKLVVSGAYVKDLAGNAMMGNSTVYFHRLFGDLDGDRDVDAKDLAVIRQKLNKPASYVPWLDYDGDGRIDNADYLQFRLRLIKPLLK